MARYMMDQYPIARKVLLLEDESRTTKENFDFSLERYPEFFEEIVSGERILGLVSDEEHLRRAVRIGSGALDCYERQLKPLPTREFARGIGQVAVLRPAMAEPEIAAMAADV